MRSISDEHFKTLLTREGHGRVVEVLFTGKSLLKIVNKVSVISEMETIRNVNSLFLTETGKNVSTALTMMVIWLQLDRLEAAIKVKRLQKEGDIVFAHDNARQDVERQVNQAIKNKR